MIWSSDDAIKDWLPKLQAHRGYWVEGLQQNSLQSIQMAYKKGYQITEFDVRMTSDNQVILFHDDQLDDIWIKQTSLADLRTRTEITTLDELLAWFVTTKDFKLNIEIKSKSIAPYRLEKNVCDLIEKYEVVGRVLISSFNPMTLYKVRLFNSKIYRALLLSFEREHGNNLVVMSGLMNYLCQPQMLNLRAVDYSKHFKTLAKKIPVVLWTVNDISIYEKYKSEIHGIISDNITPSEIKD